MRNLLGQSNWREHQWPELVALGRPQAVEKCGWRGSRLKSCLTPVPVMFQLSRRRLSQSMAYVWKRHKMA